MAGRCVVAVVAGLAVLAGCTGSPAAPARTGGAAAGGSTPGGSTALPRPDEPMRPLHGVRLAAPARLRLLVGTDRPYLLDLDGGRPRPVTGLPAGADRVVWTLPVGADAVIGSDCVGCAAAADLFVLRRGATRAVRLGTGADLIPARDGRGVWVTRRAGAGDCTVIALGLDGRVREPARPIDCRLQPRAETPQGLLLQPVADERGHIPAGTVLLTAAGGPRPTGLGRIYAAVGDRLLAGDRTPDLTVFRLVDAAGGSREVRRPTPVGTPSDGLLSPDGGYLAVSFEHPAWPGPRQRLDVWLLDLSTLGWQQLPGMPVPAALKFTDLVWTRDGRLVLLGDFDEVGPAVAIWRPGQRDLAVRRLPGVRLSSTFVPW